MAKAKYFYDDFSQTIAVSGKWTTTNAITGVVTGGVMRIRPTSAYDDVEASESYDLTGSHIGFKLVQNCAKGAGTNTIALFAYIDGNNDASIWIEGGRTLGNAATVYLRERVGGVNSDTTFTYDPAVHVWFRIREASGTIYWETSTDGTSWTTQRSKTTTLSLTSVQVILEGGYYGAEAGTTFASIDDFNLWSGVPAAPKMETLTDNFSTADTAKWTFDSGATVSGGQLTLDATDVGNNSNSVEVYDLTDSYLAMQLVQSVPVGSGNFYSEMGARISGNDFLQILCDGSDLYFQERVAGGSVSSASITYNATRHKWLRIRSAGTTITWETSKDGAAWTIQRTKVTALALTTLNAHIGAGDWITEGLTGTAIFDNVNLNSGTTIGEPNAKTETLTDSFNTTDSLKWNVVAGAAVSGGQLVLDASSDFTNYNSIDNYDFTDSYVAVQMVQPPPINGDCISEMGLYYGAGASDFIQINFDGESVYFQHRVGGGSVTGGSVTYDPLRHKWWRIRSSGTTITWETSRTGSAWTIQRTFVTTIPLTSMRIHLGAGNWLTESLQGTAIFDNFNIISGTTTDESSVLPAEFLTDDFSTESAVKWYNPHQGPNDWQVSSGQLRCVPGDYQYITTFDFWDLRESYFAFQLVQNASRGTTDYGGSITTEFYVGSDSNNKVSFIIKGGESASCDLVLRIAGVDDTTTFTYNATKDKWLRLRCAGTTIYWETSFDGATWSIKRSKTTSLNVSSVKCHFIAGFWDSNETGVGTVIIDNFNLLNISRLKELGWSVGAALPWGAVDGGTVQARNYFQAADWLWNPIPSNPVLDADSAMIGSYLAYPGANHTISWGWYGNAIVYPNQVLVNTPRYRVQLLGSILHPDWGLNDLLIDEYRIPIPYGTQIPPGGDGHLCVMDPVQGKVFSFWQMSYDSNTDVWSATTASVTDFTGDGRDYLGSSTATNLSRAAGNISIQELLAGEIPHALFVASNMTRPGNGWVSPSDPGGTPPYVYPAAKSDGRNLASVPLQYTVVEGARLQLDPSIDLSTVPNITPLEITIGRAWQVYGAYVGDQGGDASPSTVGAGAVELWQGQDYTIYDEGENPTIPVPPPYASLGVGWDYFSLNHIPWEGNIRVLRNWDGS